MDFLKPIIATIAKKGGKCMLIGGSVIDQILGNEIKDWDIEVFNISYQELYECLEHFGSPNIVGKSFGVIKIVIEGRDCDFNIPRLENRIGIKHTDFHVELRSDLSPKEAAKRRDLTINSMYFDLHEQQLIDPYDGYKDLNDGVIRATNKETFVEDPLRVLRIMQLLPRKGKVVDSATMELCRSMADEFPTISMERIFTEFEKLLLKADKPSLGLEFLRDCGWIKWFPELKDLIDCPQHPEWHPEGDVWVHTLLAVDEAAKIRHHVEEDWRLPFMFGVLLHDIGKPATTDRSTFTAYGHDTIGEPLAAQFLQRMTNNKLLIDRVRSIVKLHMQPGNLTRQEASKAAWKRLSNKLRLDVLGWQSFADKKATLSKSTKSNTKKPSDMCFTYFEEFGAAPIAPILKGQHLIELGHKPGPEMGKRLKQAYDFQIENDVKDLDSLIEYVKGLEGRTWV